MGRALGAAVGMALVAGCATTTTLQSDPAGAAVYLDGEYRGQTPVSLTLPDGSDNGYKHIRMELAGYQPVDSAISRKQDSTRVVLGYLCCYIPMLWVYKWDEVYNFVLYRDGEVPPSPPSRGFAPPPPSGPPPPSPPPPGTEL